MNLNCRISQVHSLEYDLFKTFITEEMDRLAVGVKGDLLFYYKFNNYDALYFRWFILNPMSNELNLAKP